ncbi:putative multidrug resistance-associated protein [Zancudomyces culisetae]|nr:putative multidrug resistance-associated protein [Zancudomyces culisetae]|eukprot:OMH84582.1 putative multidrug resistance-associated protein [Zancudomyces culisetae]
MIPQQPFMFEGSLRFNLDPWNEYSDTQIWKALEASELKQTVERLPNKLETQVVENGKNFSAGERQLISLCRAILGNSRLIVMDEATANIDLETDKLIQKAIHSYFKNSTVITIAHRLHTVIGGGYDKVLVLDKGAVVEFGEPWDLIQNPDSLLGKMIADTGDAMQKNLKSLAFEQWKSKRM